MARFAIRSSAGALRVLMVLPSAPAFADGVYTLGQIIAQLGQQNTNQLRESLQGQANLMTAQDQQMTAKKKQEMITQYQNREQVCLSGAKHLCKSQRGAILNTIGGAKRDYLNNSSISTDIGNGTTGNPPPNKPGSGKEANAYAYDNGRRFPSPAAAMNHLDSLKPDSLVSMDSLLPSIRQPLMGKALKRSNRYIGVLTLPVPPVALTLGEKNTVPGKQFQAFVREEQAQMSLAQSSLLNVGMNQVPLINIIQAGRSGQSSGTKGTGFVGIVDKIAMNNGTGWYVTNDEYLKAYAAAFFFNPKFYKDVAVHMAQNPTSYRRQMLYFKAAELQMQYRIMRSEEYTQATLAAMDALHVREHYEPILESLREQASRQ